MQYVSYARDVWELPVKLVREVMTLERSVQAVAAELRLHLPIASVRLRADARDFPSSGLLQDLHAGHLIPLALGLRACRLSHFRGEPGLVRLHQEPNETLVPVLSELLGERPDVFLGQRVVRTAELHRLHGGHIPLLHEGLPVLPE